MEIRRKGLALVGGVTVWFYKAGHHSQPAGGEQQTQLTIYEHTEPLVLDGRRDGKGRRRLYIRLMGHQLSPYELYAA